MIALDNGPADGDYARYIERLIAETKTASLLPAALAGPVFGSPTLPAQVAPRVAARVTPGTLVAESRPADSARRTAGGDMPTAATVVPARSSPPAASPDPVRMRAVGTLAAGLVLAAIGVLSEHINIVLLLIGIFVLASGGRALLRSLAEARSAAGGR